MAYDNLLGEMRRTKRTQTDLANLLKIRVATANSKVNGKSKFSFEQSLAIQREWFPNKAIEWLFEKDNG